MPCYDKQLIDAKNDRGILSVTPVCGDHPEFPAFINEVTRKLMRRGGWWNTEILLNICAYNGHITWPRIVGTVLGIRPCGRGPAEMRNLWWNIVGPASCCGLFMSSDWSTPWVLEQNVAPCYNEISGNLGKQIRYHVVKAQDYGKTITLFGFQSGGQPLQTLGSDGVWRPGVTITARQINPDTPMRVTRITSVVREQTQGMSYLYEIDDLRDLAQYEPSETNPQYRRVKIQNWCSLRGFRDEYDRCIKKMEALVKLQFIPVENDYDFLPISNLDALRLGIQALRFEEANDEVMARAKWDDAVKELNLELRDRFPNNQTSVIVNATSSDCALVNAF